MALTDDDVQRQLGHMIAFIEQEAKEKVEEIDAKAEEEFQSEKGRMVQEQRRKIIEYFEKKEKQIELQKKIQNSHMWNQSRLNILKTRQEYVEDVMKEARERLAKIVDDPEQYKAVIQKLIEQALFQLLENEVTIRCREVDLELVQSCVEPAISSFKEATKGRSCKVVVDDKNFLSSETIGGIDFYAQKGKIKVSNTLETRLEMIGEQLLPSIRVALFERNPNRRFSD